MSLSLIAALSWLVLANVIGMFPSKHAHWPQAYAMIAVGLPILGFVFYENDVWIGFAVMLGAASILRWPLRYLGRWLRARLPFDQSA